MRRVQLSWLMKVLMPQLGLTMEEGTVSQWIKHEGDEVKTGDVIVEITTDKLTNEVASEHDGVMLKIVTQEGEDIPVKGLLCYIGQPGEAVGDAPAAPLPHLPPLRLLPQPPHPLRLPHLWLPPTASASAFLPWPGRPRPRWALTIPASPVPAPPAVLW